MHTAVRRTLAALLFGVICTVVVAWLCGLLIDPMKSASFRAAKRPATDPDLEWHFAIHERAGATRVSLGVVRLNDRGQGKGGTVPYPEIPAEVPVFRKGWPAAPDMVVPEWGHWPLPPVQAARGWPWLAMHCETVVYTPSNGKLSAAMTDGIAVSPFAGSVPEFRVLPLGIVWPGFVRCTLFYAMVWLAIGGLFGARGYAIGVWRTRRGQCVSCGYPLGASTTCPECGHPQKKCQEPLLGRSQGNGS